MRWFGAEKGENNEDDDDDDKARRVGNERERENECSLYI